MHRGSTDCKLVPVVEALSCFSAKEKRVQPPWSHPTGTEPPKLRLYNSLTRSKVSEAVLALLLRIKALLGSF